MNEIIVKSNHVVEASYRLTLNEQRLVLSCIQKIKKGQKIDPATPFVITASEFSDMFSVSLDRAYSELQAVADRLYERSVTVYQPDPEEPKVTSTKTRWITAIDYIPTDGKVRLYFSAKMIPYISMLEGNFTRYNMEHIAGMTSVYGIRFYELMKGWLFGEPRKVKTVEINEIKQLLALKDEKGNYQYSSIKDFKLNVLDKAMTDINKFSDLQASYDTAKTGRKITHFTFRFGLKVKTQETEQPKTAPEDKRKPLRTRKESPNNEGEIREALEDLLGMQNMAKMAGKPLAEMATPKQMEKYRKYKLILNCNQL
jgi:plasmid replication initiation protein